jgi:hypothetical protein
LAERRRRSEQFGAGHDGEARALLDIGLAGTRSHGFLEAAAALARARATNLLPR